MRVDTKKHDSPQIKRGKSQARKIALIQAPLVASAKPGLKL